MEIGLHKDRSFGLRKIVTLSVSYNVKSMRAQESHKHLDEYAEMEAEILRDMEQEQAHKNYRRRQAVSVFFRFRARA